jgi:heat shock protein HslJ
MKKVVVSILGILLVTGVIVFAQMGKREVQDVTPVPVISDYKNATYVIDNVPVTLVNGVAEVSEVAGSSSKLTTRYFGNEVKKDLNGDGKEDVAFILTVNRGGSGTFYYVVGAIQTDKGYEGTSGVLLGDRIAPQTTESGPGNSIIVNYADRKQGEPMTAEPSVGKSIRLKLNSETMQFGEVVADFEGEADPARMTLDMTEWKMVKIVGADGKELVPNKIERYALTFKPGTKENTYSLKTDCNGMGGNYITGKDKTLTIESGMSTQMYCEGSDESKVTGALIKTVSYNFTSRGELVLTLKDKGSIIFR